MLESEGGSFHRKVDTKSSWGSGGCCKPLCGVRGSAPEKMDILPFLRMCLTGVDFEYFGHNSGKQLLKTDSLQQLVFSPALFAPCDLSFTAMPQTLSLHVCIKKGRGSAAMGTRLDVDQRGRSIRPFPSSAPHFYACKF